MTDIELVAETAQGLFAAECGPDVVREAEASGGFAPKLWATLARTGLHQVGIPETSGGPGGTLDEAAWVVRIAARHAAPVPLAETVLLAGPLLETTGFIATAGPMTIANGSGGAVMAERAGSGWLLEGRVTRVPFARMAELILVVATAPDGIDLVIALAPGQCRIVEGTNLAGEARDTVVLAKVAVEAKQVCLLPGAGRLVDGLAALARSVQISGALETMLELTAEHCQTRLQFGRPIGRFQAIQQQVAVLAGEVAIAAAAAEAAVDTAPYWIAGDGSDWAIAVAKSATGRAASVAAEIAHQVHGAIGVTEEHRLQHFTRRVWSWRDEAGSDGLWATRLGAAAAASGGTHLWPILSATEVAPRVTL